MITAEQIQNALGLTGVTLFGDGTITANEPITNAMQTRVKAWYAKGEVSTVRYQSGATVIRRLTDNELVALNASSNPAAIRAKMLAQSEGVISEADPDFAALTGALDSLSIIDANRWTDLLDP